MEIGYIGPFLNSHFEEPYIARGALNGLSTVAMCQLFPEAGASHELQDAKGFWGISVEPRILLGGPLTMLL